MNGLHAAEFDGVGSAEPALSDSRMGCEPVPIGSLPIETPAITDALCSPEFLCGK
jgi:hypothetical protein